MLGARVELRVFEAVVAKHDKPISEHLNVIDTGLVTSCYPWFLCLFINALPYEPTLRAFDVILHEGPKVMLRLALALMRLQESAVLGAQDAGDLYMALRYPFGIAEGALDSKKLGEEEGEWSVDDMMYFAFDRHHWAGGFSTETVKAMREAALVECQEEDAEHNRGSRRATALSESMESMFGGRRSSMETEKSPADVAAARHVDFALPPSQAPTSPSAERPSFLGRRSSLMQIISQGRSVTAFLSLGTCTARITREISKASHSDSDNE
eukprot:TRINITY_DN19688_c0_g1_i2.p2 TRINITY_DN19688_c0_g1~~TRINITY_DN19688_c0_g1_i2.p2  ORF type:complete len:268 (-),score=54.29 TRINITY_DN19688_c0_g1_i2:627-1430(-)